MAIQVLFTPQAAFQDMAFSAGATVTFYQSGTTTPVIVYRDQSLSVQALEVEADAAGVFPQVFYGGEYSLKAVVKDASAATIATIDPCALVGSSGSAAESIAFSPYTGNSSTNVQAAIEVNSGRLNDLGTPTVAGKAVLTAADATAQRTALGLGDAATAGFADEDDMVGDSATKAPSQQSVKAYVDAKGTALGTGQTWQDVSGSRADSTNYQNTTGQAISVYIRANGANIPIQVSTDAATWVEVGLAENFGAGVPSSFIVPNGHYYRISASVTSIIEWAELRA